MKVTRTHPVCLYPQVAKYKGTGDSNDEANWVCTNVKPGWEQARYYSPSGN